MAISLVKKGDYKDVSGTNYKILQGDCLIRMKELEDNSVDSIVTDPPYGLFMMSQNWDKSVPGVEFWQQAMRVLKPGGHLLAFSGSRTYHRMATAIEDAGFEIRDQIVYMYGCLSDDTEILTNNGWERLHKLINNDTLYNKEIIIYDNKNDIYKWEKPERWSVYKVNEDTAYRIKSDITDQIVSRNHNCLVERDGKLIFERAERLSEMEYVPTLPDFFYKPSKPEGKLLFKKLLRESKGLVKELFCKRGWNKESCEKSLRSFESCLEGWGNVHEEERKLCKSADKVCEMSSCLYGDVKKGWVCDGTQIKGCNGDWKSFNENGVCTPHKSQCYRQQDREFNAICYELGSQEIRTRKSYNASLAKVEEIKYTGYFSCPTVSTGAFIARRNGKVFITGNSGFPKSHNISKAIDKLEGGVREVVGISNNDRKNSQVKGCMSFDKTLKENDVHETINITAPATENAKKWNGFGTALKPAHEDICLARKPIQANTIAENVLTFGTGALNIDGCRVVGASFKELARENKSDKGMFGVGNNNNKAQIDLENGNECAGRFPANLIHDGSEEVLSVFPNTSGSSASRYFYSAKCNNRDRNEGLEEFESKAKVFNVASSAQTVDGYAVGSVEDKFSTAPQKNTHSTVKPTDLMAYLCRLITPVGGTVLDMFNGSGSTGKAAIREGFKYIGCELDVNYVNISKARIDFEQKRVDDNNAKKLEKELKKAA